MMKKGKQVIKSHMTLDYDFAGIRIQDGIMTPVDWNLSVNLVAVGKKGTPREDIERDAGLTYQKIYYWLDANLHNIVVVDVNKEDDLYIANLSSNLMMYCPRNPSDDTIIQLLHAKIWSLAGDCLIVGEVCLKGSDTSLQYTYDCPDEGYDLPDTVKEYYANGNTRDEIPWWFRDDGFSFEFIRPDDTEMTDDELFGDITDPMAEFYAILSQLSDDESIEEPKMPAKIVQVEKWTPKKVE
jgi:hypothetical protein